ncbi:hypothetical protein TDB9533_01147 [Thalassocella blandensis]|nr:hypothetical protein TDB9533_01147 [Thalassocella blandensis]
MTLTNQADDDSLFFIMGAFLSIYIMKNARFIRMRAFFDKQTFCYPL